MMPITERERLIRLIDAISVAWDNPSYYPEFENGVLQSTHCNSFVNEVARKLGCNDFFNEVTKQPLMADEIIAVLEVNPNWTKLNVHETPQDLRENDLKSIQVWANQGFLTIAAATSSALNAKHGHVCIIRPGLLKSSGKWGDIPAVANVGRENFIGRAKTGPMKGEPVGVNEAFVQMPRYYSWKGV